MLYERTTPRPNPKPESLPAQPPVESQNKVRAPSDATSDALELTDTSISKPALEAADSAPLEAPDIVVDLPASPRARAPAELLSSPTETEDVPKARTTGPRPLPKPPTQTEDSGNAPRYKVDEDVSMS